MSHGRIARGSWTPETWQPMGDYRLACNDCPWMQIEQIKRYSNRAARAHAEETGHSVEIRRQQYKTIRARPTPEQVLMSARNVEESPFSSHCPGSPFGV